MEIIIGITIGLACTLLMLFTMFRIGRHLGALEKEMEMLEKDIEMLEKLTRENNEN